MKRDYYAVLGVSVGASRVEIRRAYQRLARRYSPDVNLWEREARDLFDEIAEAYKVLGDPTARALYDRRPAPAAGRRAAEGLGRTQATSGRRGDDLHVPVHLAFAQAVSGLDADLSVERLSPCETCGATGTARGGLPEPCAHCRGEGAVWQGHGTLEPETCAACGGSGLLVSDPCPTCRGRGVTPSLGIVRVGVPAGVDTGSQFRVPGEGHAGPFGGPRGDLIVFARVHDDPVFTRKGDNLYGEVVLGLVEAVLGTRVHVPGVDGPLDLTVPPGTQGGQIFRVRGKGMPRLTGAGRGDLYVTAKVEIPRGLDARTQDLFRELGRLLPPPARTARERAT
jgi:molecular chaperone DnaJ